MPPPQAIGKGSYSIVRWIQAAQASCSGKAQHHSQGRCATISIPTQDRLRLDSIVSYSIVWWIQAAQASYSGEAQHQKKVRCATIGIPTHDRLRLHSAGYSSEEGLDSEDEIVRTNGYIMNHVTLLL